MKTHDDRAIDATLRAAAEAIRSGRGAEAQRHLTTLLDLSPDHPFALNSLGIMASDQGRHDAAYDYLRRATRADPTAPEIWLNLARAHRVAGDDAGERAALEGALAIDQRHPMANIRLAELHERRAETGEAMARWSNVLALAQHIPDPAPAMAAYFAYARAFVEDKGQAFAAEIDGGLAPLRNGLPPKDTRRFDACVDTLLGRRRIFANECAGMHFPFLPADEFFDEDLFPWFAELEAATDVIRDECLALVAASRDHFAPYVQMDAGTPVNKWTGLDGSADWNAAYLWRYGQEMAGVREICPQTMALLDRLPLNNLPGRGPTSFFSCIKGGARLPAHTGVTNVRAIVHLPLIVPPGCGFRVGGETREWRVGRAFAFDDTIDHEAWNDSDSDRIILILDAWNPHLSPVERSLLREMMQVVNNSSLDPRHMVRVAD